MCALLRKPGRRLLAIIFLMWIGATLTAGDIRHDRPDSSYTTYANLPQFNGIGRGNFFYPSAGTLINSNWILTAGHLPGITTVTFGNGGADDKTYNVVQNIAAPGWTGDANDGHDFRLLRINGNPIADGKASVIFPLYNGPVIDQVVTNVGYGWTGNGVTGFVAGTQGTRRAGNMVIRSYLTESSADLTTATMSRTVPTTMMLADFISPVTGNSTILSILNGTPTTVAAQDLEYMLAGLDSGSPALINDGGVWKIAGVASFIARPGPTAPTGIYGDISGFSVFDDATYHWILSTAIPEPGSIALVSMIAVGAVAGAWYRFRRQRIDESC